MTTVDTTTRAARPADSRHAGGRSVALGQQGAGGTSTFFPAEVGLDDLGFAEPVRGRRCAEGRYPYLGMVEGG